MYTTIEFPKTPRHVKRSKRKKGQEAWPVIEKTREIQTNKTKNSRVETRTQGDHQKVKSRT